MNSLSKFMSNKRIWNKKNLDFATKLGRALSIFCVTFFFLQNLTLASQSKLACINLFTNELSAKQSIPFDWKAAIHKIKTDAYFDFDRNLFHSMMMKAEQLTSKEKKKILKLLGQGYHQLPKQPNRRSVEFLILKLGRFDLFFQNELEKGRTALEAFITVHDSLRNLVGSDGFEADFMIKLASSVQEQLGSEDIVFLYGSSITGRSQIGSSDIDFRFFHGRNQNLPRGVFEKLIRDKVQENVAKFYKLQEAEVQSFDMTADLELNPSAWIELGNPGPFVLEIRQNQIFLYVFSPTEIDIVEPPETRPWQIDFAERFTGAKKYRLE